MEKDQLDEIMLESVSKTIEHMTFTEVLPTDLEMVEKEKRCAVTINVLEPCTGSFTMIISQKLLYFIAESMLAVPKKEIKKETILDLLSELLNTITGTFLNVSLSDNTKFALSLPEILEADSAGEIVQEMRWNFMAEETIFSLFSSGYMIECLIKNEM